MYTYNEHTHAYNVHLAYMHTCAHTHLYMHRDPERAMQNTSPYHSAKVLPVIHK